MRLLLTLLLLLIPVTAHANVIGGGSIGMGMTWVGIPQVSGQTVTGQTIYYEDMIGPNGEGMDETFLRTDVSNELDLNENDFHWDTNTFIRRQNNSEFRLYVNSTLVHTWSVSITDALLLSTGAGNYIVLDDGTSKILFR